MHLYHMSLLILYDIFGKPRFTPTMKEVMSVGRDHLIGSKLGSKEKRENVLFGYVPVSC